MPAARDDETPSVEPSLTHARTPPPARQAVGLLADEMPTPALPSKQWNGTRVTVVAGAYWNNITERWAALNDAADAAGWGAVRRVALVNSGEWYKLARGSPLYPRSHQLYKMPLPQWTKLFLDETEAALREMAAWRNDAGARTQIFVSSIACERRERDCRDALRDGLAGAIAAVGSERVAFVDTGALADAGPDERRVRGHPSLMLSHMTWNLWFTLAFGGAAGAPPPGERCAKQAVQFPEQCFAEAMMARLPNASTTSWEWLQQVPCVYSVRHELGPSGDKAPPVPPPRPPRARVAAAPAPRPKLPPPAPHVRLELPPPPVEADAQAARAAAAATALRVRHLTLGVPSALILAAWFAHGVRDAAAAPPPASSGGARIDAFGAARILASLHVALGHLSRRGATRPFYFAAWGYTWVPFFVLLSGFVLSVGDVAPSTASGASARHPARHPARAPKSVPRFVYDRVRGIYPAYAAGLAAAYALHAGPLRDAQAGALLAQAALLQAWVPAWVERCLQQHTWFLSALAPCWAAHGVLSAALNTLTTPRLWALAAACAALGWLPAILPPLLGARLDWYTAHVPGRSVAEMTHLDVAVAALKFHPLALAHLYVLGAALAHGRGRAGWAPASTQPCGGGPSALPLLSPCTRPPWVVRRGASIGYAILLAIFTVPALRPPAHKLSCRLGALAVPQGLILLGLSSGEDALVCIFSRTPLRMLGDVSFGVYILQFIAFTLYGGPDADAGYWLFLLASAVLMDLCVVRPLRSEAAFQRALLAGAALAAAALLLHGGGAAPTPLPPSPPYLELPSGGGWDARLNVSAPPFSDAAGLIINPSLAWHAHRLHVAARAHTVTRPHGGRQQLWGSGVLTGQLTGASLAPVGRMRQLHPHGLPSAPLSLAACEAAANGTAPAVFALGPEDPRLFVHSGALWASFSALVPASEAERAAACAVAVVRRVFAAQLQAAGAGGSSSRGGGGDALVRVALPASLPLRREEKNWLLFSLGPSELFAVYDIHPHTVAPAALGGGGGGGVVHVSRSDALDALLARRGPRVALHGGANPVRAAAQLRDALALRTEGMLAAFHSLDADTGAYENHLYVFDAAPPFAVRAVSAPLPLLEAPAGDGLRTGTPRGARMALLTGIAHREDDSEGAAHGGGAGAGGGSGGVLLAYGSSNAEARVQALSAEALVALFTPTPRGQPAAKARRL
jgi:peptidoglycan/LPS O-acetylase OafA/YrhL